MATGVYAIGNWDRGDADKEKLLTDIVDDQIDLTGRAFLGLTLACGGVTITSSIRFRRRIITGWRGSFSRVIFCRTWARRPMGPTC